MCAGGNGIDSRRESENVGRDDGGGEGKVERKAECNVGQWPLNTCTPYRQPSMQGAVSSLLAGWPLAGWLDAYTLAAGTHTLHPYPPRGGLTGILPLRHPGAVCHSTASNRTTSSTRPITTKQRRQQCLRPTEPVFRRALAANSRASPSRHFPRTSSLCRPSARLAMSDLKTYLASK